MAYKDGGHEKYRHRPLVLGYSKHIIPPPSIILDSTRAKYKVKKYSSDRFLPMMVSVLVTIMYVQVFIFLIGLVLMSYLKLFFSANGTTGQDGGSQIPRILALFLYNRTK